MYFKAVCKKDIQDKLVSHTGECFFKKEEGWMVRVLCSLTVLSVLLITVHEPLEANGVEPNLPHAERDAYFTNTPPQGMVVKIIQKGGTTFFLKHDGTLWGVGLNSRPTNVLGVGTSEYVAKPVLLMTNVMNMSADSGWLAVKKNGELWGWGEIIEGFEGKIGKARLVMKDIVSAQIVNGSGLLALQHDGALWMWNVPCASVDVDEPTLLLPNIVSFYVYSNSVLAVDTKNRLWGWGLNEQHQLHPNSARFVCKPQVIREGVISAAVNFWGSFYVLRNGTLVRQGTNEMYYLSEESWEKGYVSPITEVKAKKVKEVDGSFPYAFRSVDDKLWRRYYSPPMECIDTTKTMGRDATQIQEDESLNERDLDYYIKHKGVTFLIMEDVAEYSFDGAQMIVVKKDGTMWGCGDNRYGQLGLGDTEPRRQFTQIHLPPTPENAKGIFDE